MNSTKKSVSNIEESSHNIATTEPSLDQSTITDSSHASSTTSLRAATSIGLINTLAILGGILLITTLVYLNHFHNSFHFDDSHTIENNLFIRDISNIPRFFYDGTTFSSLPTNQSYRPVVTASLAIDYWLGQGLNPVYFHISTFVLFLLQGFLMFFLYQEIFNRCQPARRNTLVAALTVCWYLLHPGIAETVNYIIARSDVISTFFVVLGFVLFISAPWARRTQLYLIPIVIGALAKPPAVMFAPILLIYLILFEQKLSFTELFQSRSLPKIKAAVITSLPSWACAVFLFVFTRLMEPKTWIAGGDSRFNYLITQPYVILHYLITAFVPLQLSADSDWSTFTSLADYRVWVGVAAIAALVFAAVMTSRTALLRPVSFGICWFLIALIPTSSIVPLAEVMNDHRLFFPYIGLMMSICWLLVVLMAKLPTTIVARREFRVAMAVLLVFVLGAYAFGTYRRNKIWHSEESLWRDVTEKSPGNGRGWMAYGLTLMGRGEYAGADQAFQQALPLVPYYSYLHINIGILKDATGQPLEAEKYFQNAIAYGPNYPDTHFFYARFLQAHNRIPEAIVHLNRTLELSSAHLNARNLLMTIYQQQMDWDKLRTLAQETLQIVPGDEQATNFLKVSQEDHTNHPVAPNVAATNPTAENFLNLSLSYYQAGKYDECIKAARVALKLKPDYAEAYNNICSAYNSEKRWAEAEAACETAVRLKPDFQLAQNNLAWARDQKSKAAK